MLQPYSSHCYLLIVFGLLCGPVACARVERAKACQHLAVTVNTKLGEIEQLAPPPVPSGAAVAGPDAGVLGGVRAPDAGVGAEASSTARYRQMAELYLELSKEVASLEPEDERLAKQVMLYSRLMKRSARALERLADASASGSVNTMRAATAELKHLEERQRSASQQIDQICLSP